MLRVMARQVLVWSMAAALWAVPALASAQESDQYYADLLSSTAWCSFSYSQTTGASSTSRVIFGTDGIMLYGSSAETYTSGAAGTVAGQYGGEEALYWKVEGAALWLSQDGESWEPQYVDLSYNSEGYPILTTEDAEYSVC